MDPSVVYLLTSSPRYCRCTKAKEKVLTWSSGGASKSCTIQTPQLNLVAKSCKNRTESRQQLSRETLHIFIKSSSDCILEHKRDGKSATAVEQLCSWCTWIL